MKRWLAFICVLVLALTMSGCGAPSGSGSGSNTSADPKGNSTQYNNAGSNMSSDTAELFYAYLKENVVPAVGVCDKANFKTELEKKNMDGNTGLLSAFVEDLDNDGSPEMVTVTVGVQDVAGTVNSLVFSKGECVAVNLDLYELEDGKVVHADGPCNIGAMYQKSYGSISVYASKWEGLTYFSGYSSQDDNTTGGPSQSAVYHPESGKLVFDYVSGGAWGQGLPNAEEDNKKMNTRNMDLSYTTSGSGAYGELLSYLKFDQKDFGSVNVKFTDHTYLSEALEGGYAAISDNAKEQIDSLVKKAEEGAKDIEEMLRQLEETKNSAAAKTASSVIDHITADSGVSLTLDSEKADSDGKYSARYKAPDKAILYIETDASGAVTSISVEARTFTQTDEFIALKDAMLTAPELGLSQGTISELSGTLKTNNMQKETDGYKLLIINIDNYRIAFSK